MPSILLYVCIRKDFPVISDLTSSLGRFSRLIGQKLELEPPASMTQ